MFLISVKLEEERIRAKARGSDIRMKADWLDDIRELRKVIHNLLGNKLTLPKTVISLSKERKPDDHLIEEAKNAIDESIHLVDARFIEFIDRWEKTG